MPITEGGTFSPDNQIVSPGVFTRENDVNGITQGVADIGAVVVAPFSKGPGFSPTLVTSTTQLQQIFGVPNGEFYGPYMANEYLNQKGFVTVCRVGALTGYNQNHPLVIYAINGRYERNNDAGALNNTLSFLVPSGSYTNAFAGGLTFATSSTPGSASLYSGSGTLVFTSPTFEVTFQSNAATANIATNPTGSTSGSLLFSGQETTFTTVGTTYTANVYYSGSTNLLQLLLSGSISGSIVSGTQVSGSAISLQNYGQDPFDGNCGTSFGSAINLISSSFVLYNNGGCNSPLFRLTGYVSGSFGQYNGLFDSGSNGAPYLNSCGNLVYNTGSKILAVLADTMAGGLNNLTAPGFSSSFITVNGLLNSNSSSINQSYNLTLSSSNGFGWGIYGFDLNPSDNSYITNTFGTDATIGNPATQVTGQKIEASYLYNVFEDSIADIAADPDSWLVAVASPIQLNSPFSGSVLPLQFTDQYSLNPTAGDSIFSLTNASTPWIVSQAVAGVNGKTYRYELFQIAALGDGSNTNTAYKIDISNIKLAGTVPGSNYGTFNLSVRAFGDTENRPVYLETYQNLTLDPTSPNYIARAIGDQYSYITAAGKIIQFGEFTNVSSYIRVVMTQNNYPISVVPYGFEAYAVPIGGTVIDNMVAPMAYSKASTSTNSPGKFASGVVFGQTMTADSEIIGLYPTSTAGLLIYDDNLEYFSPVPANATIGQNTGFYLDVDYTTNNVGVSSYISSSTGAMNAIPAVITSNESTYVKMRRFVLGMQGGFDGQSPAIPINLGSSIIAGNTQGLDCSTVSSAGSVGYNQCLGALSNSDVFDINLIVMPGIFYSLHSYVAQLGIDLCEQRGDCFYIMDNIVFPSSNQTSGLINSVINSVSTIDTNYAATYYPWMTILDTNLNQIVSVPPSVLMPAVYAANDNSAAEWFAPAGLNRGGIPQATGVLDRLTHLERDELYINRINPIATFSGQGIVAWGQKTLQVASNPTNRINVRRLLISLKKFISSTSQYLVFEQNVSDTRNRFLSIVNPYLDGVQQRSGLYAYKVVMDATNNTGDVIDDNIIYGQVYLQATKTAEFVVLDFNLTATGASFPGA